jgi:hypothetical protein
MFKDLIRQNEIAEKYGLSLQRVRELATGIKTKDVFPPCEMSIGVVRFYSKHAVADYFKSRVDRRKLTGRKRRKKG